MYVVLVNFHTKREFAESFRSLVIAQAQRSLELEPACRRFDVAISQDDATSFLLYELYDDKAAFDSHLQTPHFKQFSAAVAEGVITKEISTWILTHQTE